MRTLIAASAISLVVAVYGKFVELPRTTNDYQERILDLAQDYVVSRSQVSAGDLIPSVPINRGEDSLQILLPRLAEVGVTVVYVGKSTCSACARITPLLWGSLDQVLFLSVDEESLEGKHVASVRADDISLWISSVPTILTLDETGRVIRSRSSGIQRVARTLAGLGMISHEEEAELLEGVDAGLRAGSSVDSTLAPSQLASAYDASGGERDR